MSTIYKITETSSEVAKFSYYDLSTTGSSGIYKREDNDGTTYYYRGSVTNNYLKFANKWWWIIRINGDGTIRIIYDGTAYRANGTSGSDVTISNVKFNQERSDIVVGAE